MASDLMGACRLGPAVSDDAPNILWQPMSPASGGYTVCLMTRPRERSGYWIKSYGGVKQREKIANFADKERPNLSEHFYLVLKYLLSHLTGKIDAKSGKVGVLLQCIVRITAHSS